MSRGEATESPLVRYGRQPLRPFASLVFVAPMLLIYEAGVLILGPQSMRNGADVWLRELLELVGFGQYFLLPALTCGVLLAWHHLRRDPWQVRPGVLAGMLVESAGLAVLLVFLARLQGRWMAEIPTVAHPPLADMTSWIGPLAAAEPTQPGFVERLVGFFGAGIYEELLFRLLMLSVLVAVLRGLKIGVVPSAAIAVVVSSLLFSLAHYQLFSEYGDAFQWYSFSFRFLAGVFFAVVFVTRGFGIAAGAHTIYDILVGLF